METFVKNPGYFHLARTIFEALDTRSLLRCRLSCQSWQIFIDNNTKLWMRVLADAMVQQQFNSVDDEGYFEEEEKWLTVLTAIQKLSLIHI